jgi:hypothetical protein
MRAGGFIPPEKVSQHIYLPLWTNEQQAITNSFCVHCALAVHNY